jgi:hypothetical protein
MGLQNSYGVDECRQLKLDFYKILTGDADFIVGVV